MTEPKRLDLPVSTEAPQPGEEILLPLDLKNLPEEYKKIARNFLFGEIFAQDGMMEAGIEVEGFYVHIRRPTKEEAEARDRLDMDTLLDSVLTNEEKKSR